MLGGISKTVTYTPHERPLNIGVGVLSSIWETNDRSIDFDHRSDLIMTSC